MELLTGLILSLFLTSVVGVQSAHAQSTSQQSEYRESDIGIDYHAIAEPPLDVMLSHGEVEWMQNATPVFGDETAAIWRELSAQIGTGNVSEFMIDDMKEFTPNMLRSFSALRLSDPKYGRLSSLASLFISEQFLEGVEK